MPKTRQQKRDEAEARRVLYEKRSTSEQLALIRKRPGSSAKEKAKLNGNADEN